MPHQARARQFLGHRPAGEDLLAMAPGAETGMDVDPADALAACAVAFEDRPHRLLAPGRAGAAVEQPGGQLVLPGRDGVLERRQALPLLIGRDRLLVFGRRRPGRGHQQGVQLAIAGIGRPGPAEVDAVAVEVDIVFVGAAEMGEAPGIDRMHQQHRGSGRCQPAGHFLIPDQGGLTARAAEALHAMGARGDDQQVFGIGPADQRGIGGQFLALRAGSARQDVACDGQAARPGRVEEFLPRLGVALRERHR